MPKKPKVQKVIPHDDDFDIFEEFADMHDHPSDDMVGDMMQAFIEASSHQQATAVELTRLVIENSGAATMSEKEVFALFNRASKNVSDNSLVKELLEKFAE